MSDQYTAVFARYDVDGDGRLTADEVTAAIAGMFPTTELNDLSGIVRALFAEYDTAPYAETWHETDDGLVVVTGHYRGTARSTGRPYEAEFVHLWRVTGGQITWLHQYTDTARWHEALTPA